MEGMSKRECDPRPMTESELAGALRQMERELSLRLHLEDELFELVGSLENQLVTSRSELAAKAQMERLENHSRVEDQREICRLRECLVRREQAYSAQSRELESLIYGISHDFRAPLRHLTGFCAALDEDFGETLQPDAKEYLECILRSGQKMEALLEAMLKVSRATSKELVPENVDLCQFASELAAGLQGTAPERTVIFTAPEILPICADPRMMKAAMLCLLENAWKFTAREETALIQLGVRREGSDNVYYVRDNGVGFDMRYADRLFGVFQRMHREGEFEGHGVGLAIAQRIIHRHGGKIWAEAEVGAGATFYFTLSDHLSNFHSYP
ncbi:MAG TPA: ATP-binding protein [Geomonas sp.]|nr:ATP-binding protein [Geomonas sp.]